MRPVGIEIFYWLNNWSDNQTNCFVKASQLGFDAVEISLISGPDTPIKAMRAELDRLGLGVFASMGLPLDKDITSSDAPVRRSGIEYLKRCVGAAAELGSPILGGLPYVPWLQFPGEHDLRPYRDRSAAAIREVAVTASDLGITICIEIINRFETYIFNTVQQGLDYLVQVDHPSVRLQLDTYHMNMEEDDIPAAIRLAGSRLGHFHCADSNRKPPGGGHIRWSSIRDALDAVCYSGPTVNTWRPLVQDYDADIANALSLLRHQVA
jgi:D-psicose/D-tagatose/L-ribulose 3-epimerase